MTIISGTKPSLVLPKVKELSTVELLKRIQELKSKMAKLKENAQLF